MAAPTEKNFCHPVTACCTGCTATIARHTLLAQVLTISAFVATSASFIFSLSVMGLYPSGVTYWRAMQSLVTAVFTLLASIAIPRHRTFVMLLAGWCCVVSAVDMFFIFCVDANQANLNNAAPAYLGMALLDLICLPLQAIVGAVLLVRRKLPMNVTTTVTLAPPPAPAPAPASRGWFGGKSSTPAPGATQLP